MDSLELLEGDTFQQSCIAHSSPPPLLQWLKEGQMIMDPSVTVDTPNPAMSTIVIVRVTQAHSGGYTCLASNRAGKAEETIHLTVNGIFCLNTLIYKFLFIHFYLFIYSLFALF